ncbi:transcriptional regulator, BadM/Rrf2 family [Rhizobium sp. RU36D]|nr:transcriptional regulator, BadM/Rrf2 family [Rhizobium sp. RU36D]
MHRPMRDHSHFCALFDATTRELRMLTNKGKYGLKALVDLARLESGETAFVNEIAVRNNIPKKFLDTILLELRNTGILRSKKGPNGGYSLSKPASEIMIGQVIRTLDGPLAPIRCASRTAFEACDDCQDPETCQVRRSMTEVRDAIAMILDNMTLAQFVMDKTADKIVAIEKEAG